MGATAAWAKDEQKGAASIPPATAEALAQANRDYEAKHGFIFIVCATGRTADEMLADLRAGRRSGRFKFKSDVAAADLVSGTVLAGMRSVLERRAGEDHAAAIAALVLRGLGVAGDEADEIAQRPLPTEIAQGPLPGSAPHDRPYGPRRK